MPLRFPALEKPPAPEDLARISLVVPAELIELFRRDEAIARATFFLTAGVLGPRAGYCSRTAAVALWQILHTEGTIWETSPHLQATVQDVIRQLFSQDILPPDFHSPYRVTHFERIATSFSPAISVEIARYLGSHTIAELFTLPEHGDFKRMFDSIAVGCAQSAASQFVPAFWPLIQAAQYTPASSEQSSCVALLLVPALYNLLSRRWITQTCEAPINEDEQCQRGDSQRICSLAVALQELPKPLLQAALQYAGSLLEKRTSNFRRFPAMLEDLSDASINPHERMRTELANLHALWWSK